MFIASQKDPMFQALQELTDETERLQKKIEERGKAVFLQATQDLLDKFPQIRALHWTQYTPYFNDGDPCYFRVNSLNVLMSDPEKTAKYEAEKRAHKDKQATAKALSEEQRKKLGIELEEWIDPGLESLCEDEYVSSYSADKKKAKYGHECWGAIVQLAEWIEHKSNQDTMEAVFGDHVEVTVTRKGAEITEHEHD